MGEYAKRKGTGERVKIGTCEDMLYLRADQINLVWPEHGNVNPASSDDQKVIRFRFPWPDEDNVAPGEFDDPFRKMRVDLKTPAEVEHHSVQFIAKQQGYNVCLPCPEAHESDVYRVARNGFAGSTFLVQQAYRNGLLVAIFECACGARWRAETLADAAPAIEGLLAEADRIDQERERAIARDGKDYGPDPTAERLRTIAVRIGAGYRQEVPA
jgi:hypothetical protein